MFYEQYEIIDVLNCEHCYQPYGEFYPPRILPCCSKTICYNCIKLIENQTKLKKFKCIACNKEETIPNDGFLINNVVGKLLKIKNKIYEESEIKDLLKCEHCSKPYGDYYPPKILSCCGKTVCNTCVMQIENQLKNNKYKCIACSEIDTMPKNGFNVNHAVAKLIEKQPKEIPRGLEAENLKQNLGELDDLVKKLLFEMENGEYLITEDCRELRRQVQLAKEEKIEEINKYCDALILRIDTYEEECKSKYNQMNEQKEKANDLINLVNKSINQQNAYLRQLAIDDKEVFECNQKMNQLKTQIENERKSIKKSMLSNQTMKFEANKTKIIEKILEELILLKFEFTKMLSASVRSIKLLDMNTSECLKTFEGHTDWVLCVKLLNENQIVSCSKDKTIKIWDIETGDCIKTLLGHSNVVWKIAILSNNRIVSCSREKAIRIWDVESGDCIKILNGHNDYVYSIVKHSNECVLSGSMDRTIKLWNVNSGECLRTVRGHLNTVLCVETLSNERIMSGSCDETLKVWNVQNDDCLHTFKGYSDLVYRIKFLCEDRIISGSKNGEIRIWCLKTNSCIQTIKAHTDYIRDIQVISNNQVASCSVDKTIKIWDLTSASCIKTIENENAIYSIEVI